MPNPPGLPDTGTLFILSALLFPTLFPLGHVVATSGALDLLDRLGINANTLLTKHERGDWGILCQNDAVSNDLAIKTGGRVLSAYLLGNPKEWLWIITEHDRSVTTLLLPEEY